MDNRTIEQKLGAAIMMRRRNQLISQEDFARKPGINRSYMSSIENGKRIVSVSVIERVAGRWASQWRNYLFPFKI